VSSPNPAQSLQMTQKEFSCYGRYNKDRPWLKKLKKKNSHYQQQGVRAKAEAFVINGDDRVSNLNRFHVHGEGIE